MDDIDKEINKLTNNYSKLDLAQMIIGHRLSIDTLNEIITKLKKCGNCENFVCGICNINGADVLGEREPCEKWKMYE